MGCDNQTLQDTRYGTTAFQGGSNFGKAILDGRFIANARHVAMNIIVKAVSLALDGSLGNGRRQIGQDVQFGTKMCQGKQRQQSQIKLFGQGGQILLGHLGGELLVLLALGVMSTVKQGSGRASEQGKDNDCGHENAHVVVGPSPSFCGRYSRCCSCCC